jgi:hypothetical protein
MIIDFENAKAQLQDKGEPKTPEPQGLSFGEQAIRYARLYTRERIAELRRAQPTPK